MKYLNSDGLTRLVFNIADKFATKTHKHTSSDISDYDIASEFNSLNADIEALQNEVSDLSKTSQYKIVSMTQGEYNALTTVDSNTLYIIEV